MNKGTLTILSSTEAVLGFPAGSNLDEKSRQILLYMITQWLDTGGNLFLPFPVEVTDLRDNKIYLSGHETDSLTVDLISRIVEKIIEETNLKNMLGDFK